MNRRTMIGLTLSAMIGSGTGCLGDAGVLARDGDDPEEPSGSDDDNDDTSLEFETHTLREPTPEQGHLVDESEGNAVALVREQDDRDDLLRDRFDEETTAFVDATDFDEAGIVAIQVYFPSIGSERIGMGVERVSLRGTTVSARIELADDRPMEESAAGTVLIRVLEALPEDTDTKVTIHDRFKEQSHEVRAKSDCE